LYTNMTPVMAQGVASHYPTRIYPGTIITERVRTE
jgi:hypothetical protein